ncbi:60 kda ss-a ro ribonucleo [Lasius niger]|uniref:60 kDa ss-a ro ribonucleo n=1 Tax=Lasius niger TaxID=67767 RepID=A0A0J7NYF2_LASNI|nr:60 kda ss-a ro ribonucleo [Lasius niger]
MAGNLSLEFVHFKYIGPRQVNYSEKPPPQQQIVEVQRFEEPEIRLARFLYIGKEYANYQPGYWFAHNYFIIKNVPSIEELADNEEKQLVPIEIIIKAFESNLVPHPETLVFALAICCRQDKSEKLRAAAYENVGKICVSPQDFILFINFASRLCREKELNYVTQGWGNGFRKAVNNWYLSKEPLDLAKCVTKYKSRYGWKHKDIVKMSHPSTNSPEKELVLKYVLYGMVKIKADLNNQSENPNNQSENPNNQSENPNINEILKYIQDVEDFKHCEDEVRAAALLETYGFSLEHVPGHLLKSKEHQQSTNLRYLLTISTNKAMEAPTWHNANMTGVETGCLIAMMLLRCETNVTIATYKNVQEQVTTVNVDKTQSFSNILDILKTKTPVGGTNLSKPILWAKNEKAKYDVFINVVDQVYERCDDSQNTFISYRDDMKLPQAK